MTTGTIDMKSVDEQMALIRRGVDDIVPEAELKQKLAKSIATGKPLRVKYGIDPTGIDVHLGHTVPLRKLRVFQELGHHAILIIGNYTAMVGDPSGRDKHREGLTEAQVEANAKDYIKQVSKVIDLEKTEVHYNGNWFAKFGFLDVLRLTSQMTIQRMLDRDDFSKRVKAGTPIYLHECLYPLMQGRDSVEIKADVELGGSEQLFSLMVGRELQKDDGQEPQVCITLPILRGTDGVRRMGKSLGNYVGIGESAYEIFAKVMSIADDLMAEWYQLLTEKSEEDIKTLTDASKTHPMDAKKTLAREIVGFYYGPDEAQNSQTEWERRFSQKKDPSEIESVLIPGSEIEDGKIWICKLLVLLGLSESNNAARRSVQSGAVTIGPDKTKITDPKHAIELTDGLIVRIGSRNIRQVQMQ